MVSAGISMAQTARAGGSMEDVMLSGAIAFGSGAIGAGMGQIGAGVKGVGAAFGRKVLSFATGLATAYGAAALTGGLNRENWDDILKSYSINFAVSSAANGVAGKIQEKISKSAGMGGSDTSLGSSPRGVGESGKGDRFGQHWVKDADGNTFGIWSIADQNGDIVQDNPDIQQTMFNVRDRVGSIEGGGAILHITKGKYKGHTLVFMYKNTHNNPTVGFSFKQSQADAEVAGFLGMSSSEVASSTEVLGYFHTHPSDDAIANYPSFKELQKGSDTNITAKVGSKPNYVVTKNNIWKIDWEKQRQIAISNGLPSTDAGRVKRKYLEHNTDSRSYVDLIVVR